MMQAVLPHMRAARRGVIVNVSSIAGRIALPFNSLYNGTKFGRRGVSESAAIELAPLGVRVRIVEPGGVRSNFANRGLVATSSDTVRDYDTMFANAYAGFGSITAGGSDSDVIAKAIFKAVMDESDKVRFPAGDDALRWFEERAGLSDEEHQKKMTQKFNLLNEDGNSF